MNEETKVTKKTTSRKKAKKASKESEDVAEKLEDGSGDGSGGVDSEPVSEAGQDEASTVSRDEGGRSETASRPEKKDLESERILAEEKGSLPEGVEVMPTGGEVAIRISQKYMGGWVKMNLKQWETLIEKVKEGFGS